MIYLNLGKPILAHPNLICPQLLIRTICSQASTLAIMDGT